MKRFGTAKHLKKTLVVLGRIIGGVVVIFASLGNLLTSLNPLNSEEYRRIRFRGKRARDRTKYHEALQNDYNKILMDFWNGPRWYK